MVEEHSINHPARQAPSTVRYVRVTLGSGFGHRMGPCWAGDRLVQLHEGNVAWKPAPANRKTTFPGGFSRDGHRGGGGWQNARAVLSGLQRGRHGGPLLGVRPWPSGAVAASVRELRSRNVGIRFRPGMPCSELALAWFAFHARNVARAWNHVNP
jgi:hypothetical protein